MRLIFLALFLSGCSSAPYVKPKIVVGKTLSESSKPDARATIEFGVILSPEDE